MINLQEYYSLCGLMNPEYCALCGLIIPCKKLIPNLPKRLHRTIDHLYPRSKGGSNKISNRKPAHDHCNTAKKDCVAVTYAWVSNQQTTIIQALDVAGITFSKNDLPKILYKANNRIKVPITMNHKSRNRNPWERISYWEDDGGPPGCYNES